MRNRFLERITRTNPLSLTPTLTPPTMTLDSFRWATEQQKAPATWPGPFRVPGSCTVDSSREGDSDPVSEAPAAVLDARLAVRVVNVLFVANRLDDADEGFSVATVRPVQLLYRGAHF